MKKGGTKEIYIEKDVFKAYPSEIKEQMKAIDKIDCFVFVEDMYIL